MTFYRPVLQKSFKYVGHEINYIISHSLKCNPRHLCKNEGLFISIDSFTTLKRPRFISFSKVGLNWYSSDARQNSSDSSKAVETDTKGHSKKTLEGGVVIQDLIIGNGLMAKRGKTISVHYSGKLKSTNKVFDEVSSGPGLSFRLGRGDVIDGWDIGVVGMKVGGRRMVTCPPAVAYGAKGSPPVIPPNSTLIFEVVLKNVK